MMEIVSAFPNYLQKDIMTLIHMQRELFLAEIKDTKPDIIIYFTGGKPTVRSLSKQW